MNKFLDLELRKEIMATLSQYAESIKLLKVDYLGCREFYPDGTSMAFCSNERWYEVGRDEGMMTEMSIHYAQELITLKKNNYNYIVRTSGYVNNRFLRELLIRDMCNSLLVYRKDKGIIRMYSFIANNSNLTALSYFFNKHQMFENTVDLYQEKLANIFQKEKYQVLRHSLFSSKMAKVIFDQEEVAKPKISCSNLTSMECEYIPLLINGATNKDLALKFNISARTAQYHVANIKKKLKVNSRFSIHELMKTQQNN